MIKTNAFLNIHKENAAISGAKIEIKDGYVIKSGSPRLVSQASKQFFFDKNININNFYAPHIYEIGKNYFKMKNINGQSWYDFFLYSEVSNIQKFFDSIVRYLNYLKVRSSPSIINDNILIKLESLYGHSRYKGFIKYLQSLKIEIVPTSFCHGDLTLSNMIFKDGIYLIDFLDSFVESYLIDIIKIRQDCYYKWCLIYNDIESIKCEIILNKLHQIISKNFPQEINSNIFKLLEAINILRIEPYISEKKAIIISKLLKQNFLYADFNRSNLR